MTVREAQAVASTADSIPVLESRVVVHNGVVCAFLHTKSVARAFQWKSGTMAGKNRFRTFSSVASHLKKTGHKKGVVYREAVARARSSDRICGRLSSLKFKTTGVVALGVKLNKSVKSKGVRSTGLRVNAIGDLYGIRIDGSTTPVIGLVNPSDKDAGNNVQIDRVYQAPDTSIYTLYQSHPEGCRLGRVPADSQIEVCVLSNSDIPEGMSFGEAPTYLTDTNEPVRFDGIGHAYVIISGRRTSGKCAGVKYGDEEIIQIDPSGVLTWLQPETCREGIGAWAPLTQGGVIFWRMTSNSDTYYCYIECSNLMVWKNGSTKPFLTNFAVASNGLRTMPSGQVFISLFAYQQGVFSSNNLGGQGGVLMYDEQSETLVPWWHYRASAPVFAVEDIADKECGCKSQIGIMSPLVRGGNDLYGVATLFNGTTPQTAIASQTYLWRVAPFVEPIAPINTKGIPTLAAAMAHSLVVSTSDYVSCNITANHFRYIDACKYNMVRINLLSREVTPFITESDGIAVLTLTSDTINNTVKIQAIRLSDKKYLVGTLEENSSSVSWTVASSIQFEFLTTLEKLNEAAR